jgi:hypothetical protein
MCDDVLTVIQHQVIKLSWLHPHVCVTIMVTLIVVFRYDGFFIRPILVVVVMVVLSLIL